MTPLTAQTPWSVRAQLLQVRDQVRNKKSKVRSTCKNYSFPLQSSLLGWVTSTSKASLNCRTNGAEAQSRLDSSCLCACVLHQFSLFLSCVSPSSKHSFILWSPFHGHLLAMLQLIPLLVCRYPAPPKWGKRGRKVLLYKWEKKGRFPEKMIQEPVVQAGLSSFPT